MVMHCAIWYYLYNLKNLKITDEGVLLFNAPGWVFFTFFKLYKWYQLRQVSHILYVVNIVNRIYKFANLS